MATPTATSGLAAVNGIELAYRVFGEGDPLILLHGGFGSVEMFRPNVDALAAGRRVIGVDLQSHGRSPAADRPMRFETMADDIEIPRGAGWREHVLASRKPSQATYQSPFPPDSSARPRQAQISLRAGLP